MTSLDTTISETDSVPRAMSVLAPILLGVHLPTTLIDPVDLAIQVATMSVPAVPTDRKVLFKGARKPTTVTHQRRLLQGRLQRGGYYMRLCDCRPNATSHEWMGKSQWQLTAKILDAPSFGAGIPADATAIKIAVTHFRLQRRTIQSARQLALARYCLVEAFKAVDPHLIISSSGQTDWHPSWWREPETH
jgi:hypothetical protein